MQKAKLLENTAGHGANGILKNETIAVPLRYSSNFWRLFKMSLIKFKWTKNCVLSVAGADNANANSINIIFTIKDNKKPSKLLSKELKRSLHWNEQKTKNENKNTTN